MKDLRIIFMGTPDFAVGILDAIHKQNYNIVAVITAADKPAGRGQKIKYSAVKEYAVQHELPLLQPTNLKDPDFITELASYNANLQVVVAFRMLPEIVWKMPEYGTFNLHASLLPDYRGAAPINWAIMNGETKTGVTTFFIDDKIDTGAIITNEEIDIDPNENVGQLHDKLMMLGAKTVLKTLELIANDQVTTLVQPEEDTKTAYKLNKDNCKIDFSKTVQEIHNHIRGLSPYPSAWCYLINDDKESSIKIYKSSYTTDKHDLEVGTIVVDHKLVKVACKNGYLIIENMQLPGKKQMNIKDLLNGFTFSDTAKLM